MDTSFTADLVGDISRGGGIAVGLALLLLAPLVLKDFDLRLAKIAALFGLSIVVTWGVQRLALEFRSGTPAATISLSIPSGFEFDRVVSSSPQTSFMVGFGEGGRRLLLRAEDYDAQTCVSVFLRPLVQAAIRTAGAADAGPRDGPVIAISGFTDEDSHPGQLLLVTLDATGQNPQITRQKADRRREIINRRADPAAVCSVPPGPAAGNAIAVVRAALSTAAPAGDTADAATPPATETPAPAQPRPAGPEPASTALTAAVTSVRGLLNADNALVRRDARRDLGRLGTDATEVIRAIVTAPSPTYRDMLGVAEALGRMESAQRCSIAQFAAAPLERFGQRIGDDTYRNALQRAVGSCP